MEYNIINEYIDFIKKELYDFFKIILGKDYQKKICQPFIDRYVIVRYYNETNYPREKDIVNRLNKELVDIYKDVLDEENEDLLKNIVALFGYIIYFDDIYVLEEVGELIKLLADDENIKIEHEDNLTKNLRTWYIGLKKGKEKFNNTILSKDFTLTEKRLYRKIFSLDLEHNVKISNLYSEYAINKAYNSGIINEDKLFITCILGSYLVLNNAIGLDFSRHYIVDMANTLFNKEKKLIRLFGVLDNVLDKKFISFRVTYQDYIDNKDKINKLINDGYSFGIIIDNNFTGNINELVLFPYIFVSEDNEYYDMIVNDSERIMSKVIKL